MIIKISEFQQEIKMIKQLKERYENIYLNYYSKINEVSNQWNNEYEKKLMQNVEDEKIVMNMVNNDLDEMISLFKNIEENYSRFGKKIVVDVDNKKLIIQKIDNCISYLNSIVYLCNNLALNSMDDNQPYKLNSIKNIGIRELNVMNGIKNSIVGIIDEVKNIERSLKKSILRVNMEMVKVTDIYDSIEPELGEFNE